MSKKSKIVSKLKRALETPSIFKVSRSSFSDGPIHGFVVGLSEKWVLMKRTADGGYSEGILALRVRDVTKLEKGKSFATEFARTQPQPDAQTIAAIELDNVASLLATISKLSPVVAIEREEVFPGGTVDRAL
jgi:hypothetical protein